MRWTFRFPDHRTPPPPENSPSSTRLSTGSLESLMKGTWRRERPSVMRLVNTSLSLKQSISAAVT